MTVLGRVEQAQIVTDDHYTPEIFKGNDKEYLGSFKTLEMNRGICCTSEVMLYLSAAV